MTPIGWADFDGPGRAPTLIVNNNDFERSAPIERTMNLQITAVIDPADQRSRMKNRRGGGRAQFVSFNFPNTLIWAIESTARDGRQSQPARGRQFVVRATAQSDISSKAGAAGARISKSARRVLAHRAAELSARQQCARSRSEGADVVVDA
jgi:hypothetical protein